MARTLPAAAYWLIGAVGTSRVVTRLHPVAYRWFGSAGPIGRSFGIRSVVLTTVGSRSGLPREVPLYALEDGDRFVVIASKGGEPTHPDWYHNLLTHPEATVEVGAETVPVRAQTAQGAERRRLFDQQAALMPFFAEYERTSPRTIPVVILTRREASG